MKKFTVLVVMALTFLALSALAANIEGYIADSNCAAKQGAKVASEGHVNCAAKCIKGGAQAVLVTPDGKIYKLSDQAEAAKHAGHKVTVNGKVEGDTIQVSSIKM